MKQNRLGNLLKSYLLGHLLLVVIAAPVASAADYAGTAQFEVAWAGMASYPDTVEYVLEESDSPLFIGAHQVPLPDHHATRVLISGKTEGTYYYRVKATAPGWLDSGWTSIHNGCTVTKNKKQVSYAANN